MYKIFKNIILLFPLYIATALAQDSFFPDNYVKGGMEAQVRETPTPSAPSPQLAPESEITAEPESDPEVPIEGGTKISQIGIIVNSDNAAHVQSAINEFNRIIDTHKSIETLFIVLVGDQKTALEAAGPALSQMELNQEMVKEFMIKALLNPVTEEDDVKAKEREIMDSLSETMFKDETLARRLKTITKLSIVNKVPDEYKITHSPGWILDTARGRIMVEGIVKLGTYINEKGEFVESMLTNKGSDLRSDP